MAENMDIQVTYEKQFKVGRPKLTNEERIERIRKRNKEHDAKFVSLGCEYERWLEIKAERNLKTNRAVAAFLINYYRHGEANKQSSIPISAGGGYNAHDRPSTIVSLEDQLKENTDDCIVMKQEYVGETIVMPTRDGNNTTCNSTGNSVNNPQKQVTGQNSVNNPQKQVTRQNSVNNPQKQITGQNGVNNPQKQVTGQNCVNNPQKQITGQNSINTDSLDNQDEVKDELNSDDTLVNQLNSGDTLVDHTYIKTSHKKAANTPSTTTNKESTTATNNPSTSSSSKTTTHYDDSAKNADSDQISVSDGDDLDKDSEDEFLEKVKRKMVDDNHDKVFPVVKENHSDVKFSARSSRIRSRGFRPNYAALDWSSDSEKSASDHDADDEKKDDDEYIISDYGDHMDNDEEEDMEYSDEDYVLSDEEFDVKTDEDGICLDESQKSIKRRKAAKNAVKNNAFKKEKALKKLQDEKDWKSIKLEDHQDKFCEVDIKSFERQHRGNSRIVEKGYKCLVCQCFKCSDEKTLHYHLEEHENKVLECSVCDFSAASPKELQIHQNKERHFENARYVCEICGLAFKNKINRNVHYGSIHDIPVHKCGLCPEKFARRFTRNEHMREAHPDQCEFCVICRRSFTKSNFEKHAKFCKTNEVCDVCGKVMNTIQLQQHMTRFHSGIRRHQCTLCDYSAKFSTSLRRHMLTHNKKHPFQCDQCAFSCNQASQLKSHMRTHSGEKPFKCTLCNYAATWNVQLKDHVKIHGMPGTVMCNQCGILFKNKRSLDLHSKKEHS